MHDKAWQSSLSWRCWTVLQHCSILCLLCQNISSSSDRYLSALLLLQLVQKFIFFSDICSDLRGLCVVHRQLVSVCPHMNNPSRGSGDMPACYLCHEQWPELQCFWQFHQTTFISSAGPVDVSLRLAPTDVPACAIFRQSCLCTHCRGRNKPELTNRHACLFASSGYWDRLGKVDLTV